MVMEVMVQPPTCQSGKIDTTAETPAAAWTAGKDSFQQEVKKLGGLFNENFKKYESEATDDVKAAAPTV